MNTLLKFIGLFDHQDCVHGVELKEGLNLITGRSSTGKSSLIEIFDFCMASSEDTIPHGVIKDNAALFFLWITINRNDYLLGRDANGKDYYIVYDPNIDNILDLKSTVFDGNDYVKEDYIIQLGLLFGIDTTNTAETAEQLKDKRKGAGRPSIRNMMPFILQHQNLVANKQALFYRFDQKEKRDDTIGQFKVFAGFVDANYYALSVEVSSLREKIEVLKKKMTKAEDDIQETYNKLMQDLSVYTDITGKQLLLEITPEKFQQNPQQFKEEIEKLDYFDIKIDPNNQVQLQKYRDLEKQENHIMAELREAQVHLEEIKGSIDYIDTYKDALEQIPRPPQELTINYSVCPFCHQHTSYTTDEANKLRLAIGNLNDELKGIPSIIRPLHEERIKIQETIGLLKVKLEDVDKKKSELDGIIQELKRNYSLQKQAYKTIYKISSRIELASNEALNQLRGKIEELTEDLKEKQTKLSVYDVKGKMNLAERAIRQSMTKYRRIIPFESSLNDYELVFDLNKFELFFTKGSDEFSEKKYLRAIGSGANWLNAHLCLFLSLADFFYNQTKSTVPSLLFFDQPSQVYFPAQKDKGEIFNPKEESVNEADEDLAAVNNIFSLLYKYCSEHQYGIQIIVTDHADDLTINGLDNFNSIVRARWRKDGEGLVDVKKIYRCCTSD
jgi:hypothetical protein